MISAVTETSGASIDEIKFYNWILKVTIGSFLLIPPTDHWFNSPLPPFVNNEWKFEQDGRLAPAFFSPNYKYFDQLLQTVKNKTTVLILVFKECLQTSIRSLISVLYAKGYHDFPLKKFCLTVPKNFVEEPFCVSQNFWYRKMLGIREGAGITIFCQNCFVSQYRKTS